MMSVCRKAFRRVSGNNLLRQNLGLMHSEFIFCIFSSNPDS